MKQTIALADASFVRVDTDAGTVEVSPNGESWTQIHPAPEPKAARAPRREPAAE